MFNKRLQALQTDFQNSWQKLNLDAQLAELHSLEQTAAEPELWLNPERAKSVHTALARQTAETEPWVLLKTQLDDLGELLALDQGDLTTELDAQLTTLEQTYQDLKKSLRFTGPYDQNDAILRITAGVGGTEAMDWAGMLERMYLRFAERHHFKATCLERTTGEEAGIKTAVYELSGPHALSPFNADNLRQTSFALVEVLPVITTDDAVQLNDKDLRIDVYHSGGHGGQSVNTTNSAVRITHLPTGTVVAIQNERSQQQNKAKALEILRGKLAQMQQEQHAASINELRAGESAKWGQQIRNYVLQPYKLVKDTRTKHESTDPDAVLDGKLDDFIDAYLDDAH